MKTFSAMNNFNAEVLDAQARAAEANEPDWYDYENDPLGVVRRMFPGFRSGAIDVDLVCTYIASHNNNWNSNQPRTCVGFFGRATPIPTPLEGARGYLKKGVLHQDYYCNQLMCPTCWCYRMVEAGYTAGRTRFPYYQVRVTNAIPYTDKVHPKVLKKFKAADTKRTCIAWHIAIGFEPDGPMSWRYVGLFGSYEPIKPAKNIEVTDAGQWVGAVMESQYTELTGAYVHWLGMNRYPYSDNSVADGLGESGHAVAELQPDRACFRMHQDDLDAHLANSNSVDGVGLDLDSIEQYSELEAVIQENIQIMKDI